MSEPASPIPPGAIPVRDGVTMAVAEHDDLLKMQKFVYGRTVAIHVDSRNTCGIEMGSGVVIDIGKRTFVASEGHVLSKNPRVLLKPTEAIELGSAPTKSLKREFRDPPDDLDGPPIPQVMDIGFQELPSGSVEKMCHFESLIDFTPPENTLTMIVGHPIHARGSLADPKWEKANRYELVRTAHSASVKEVRDDKFVFGYPKEVLDLDSKTRKMTTGASYKSPEGFSGGGLWVKRDLSVIKGVIYPRSRYRLLGLDYAWSKERAGTRAARERVVRRRLRRVARHRQLHADTRSLRDVQEEETGGSQG